LSFEHNRLSHGAAVNLLEQLQKKSAAWSTQRLTEQTTYWHGMADWPRPDIAFEDKSTNASLAIEFKPPGQPKREYVTGLGQAITYLEDFEFAAIILPKHTEDTFPIAQYIKSCLNQPYSSQIPIGLFEYTKDPSSPTDLVPLINLRPRTHIKKVIPKGIGRRVFWSYWRDLSNYDLLILLSEMMKSRTSSFKSAYRTYWKKFLTKGKALTWEDKKRKSKDPLSASFKSEELNAFLSLRHIGLINSENRLTEEGSRLARLGIVYGPDSASFLSFLANRVLSNGRHLDLVFWVDEQQRKISADKKQSAHDYYVELDICLQKEGIIPSVPDGSGKPTFLRDEQKLWNKLGLLVLYKKRSYFHPGIGLAFSWRNIISAVNSY